METHEFLPSKIIFLISWVSLIKKKYISFQNQEKYFEKSSFLPSYD